MRFPWSGPDRTGALTFAALLALTIAAGGAPSIDGADKTPFEAPAAAPPMGASRAMLPGPWRAEVIRVIDGDTFEARVTVWPGMHVATLVRLRGVDAPELQARCDHEARRARESRQALVDILASAPVWLSEVSHDKYAGRVLAQARVGDDDVSDLLLVAGYARPYQGGRRGDWCAPMAMKG